MSDLSSYPGDMGAIAGPLLIGHFLQWGLFGALSLQVYLYLALSNDPPYRKALVYVVYAVELAQTILYTKMAFQEFAAGFGNILALEKIGLLWFAAPILTAIVSFLVQIFYAWRIKILTESYFISTVVTSLALLQLGGGISEGLIDRQISLFYSDIWSERLYIATIIWNGCSAACNLLIAASMTCALSQRKTIWKPTERIVQRLTRLIIATGALTAAVAITNLALFVWPGSHPTYYQTAAAILGKLYSNSMMVVLNSRVMFAQKESMSTEFSSISLAEFSRRPQVAIFGTLPGDIMVTREQWTTPPETSEPSNEMHAQ